MSKILNIQGRLLSLKRPQIMGILNATPDSFYAQSRQKTVLEALRTVEKMIAEGASIVDIGGMSTRPGAALISPAEEQTRIMPIISAIAQHFGESIFISVDTIYGSTAKVAVEAGAGIINDISAGQFDPNMLPMVAQLRVPYILMHTTDIPARMQQKTAYPKGVVTTIFQFLAHKIQHLRQLGIIDIVLDLGFGFGKTTEQNFTLLHNLDSFAALGLPLLVGVSRKGMVWRTLQISPDEALNGTTVLHTLAIQQGVNILRVHDVAAARQVVELLEAGRN